MIRWLTRSLLGRTVLVLVAGVLLSNGIALMIVSDERLDVLTGDRGRAVAERVVAAGRLIADAPVGERRRLARSLRGPGLWLFWGPAPVVADAATDPGTKRVFAAFAAVDDGVTREQLRLSYGRPPAGDPPDDMPPRWGADDDGGRFPPPGPPPDGPRPAGPPFGHGFHRPGMPPVDAAGTGVLFGSLALSDGTWLNFAAPLAIFTPFWVTPAFAAIVAVTLTVLVVSLVAVWQASRPLTMLARAADRLGRDMHASPLPEAGPTEVQDAARAFNRMQRELQALVRDRSHMLAAIAHDLRTPITRLKLRTELIAGEEVRRKFAEDLDEMEAMVAATLAFVRDGAAEEAIVAIDLAALLQTLADDAADAGAEAAYAGPSRLAWPGRPKALKRAFGNLIDNALKYGGRARITLAASATLATVTVDDDGPGIPDSETERVFQPFYRLETSRSRDGGGVGLGLAVVRSVIRAHRGEVMLANRAAGGLAVIVTLPRTPAASVAPTARGDLA